MSTTIAEERERLEVELANVRAQRKIILEQKDIGYSQSGRQIIRATPNHLQALAAEEARILKQLARLERGGIPVRSIVTR